MKKKNVLKCTKKLTLGIALALGCNILSMSMLTNAEAAESVLESGAIMEGNSKLINMAADSADITYDKYTGYKNYYVYEHDSTDVTKILGGDITITSAGLWAWSEGATPTNKSSILLATDSSGIDVTDTKVVDEVLRNLAGKLTYSAYTEGERNLYAQVMIDEGITSSSYSSAADAYQDVYFDSATGKGSVVDSVVVMGRDSSDITIDEYKGIKQTYTFTHNPDDPTEIYGGKIIIKKSDSTQDATTNNNLNRGVVLVTDSSGIDPNDKEQLSAVLNALASKVVFEGFTDNRYGLNSSIVKIADGITSSDWTYASGSLTFDSETFEGKIQYTPSISHIYTGVMTGNLDKDKENGYNNGYNLQSDGNGGYYSAVMIRPEVTDKSEDAVLAAINMAAGKDITSIALSNTNIIDISKLSAPNGKVYFIYNNGGGTLDTGYSETNVKFQGENPNAAGAIYAANPDGDTKSTITTAWNLAIDAPDDGFTAVEAGKNGEISFSKSSGSLSIDGNGHKINAIVAGDGGVVNIGKDHNNRAFYVNIDAGDGNALYAKDGGTINLFNQSMYINNMKGDVVSEGTGKIGTVSLKGGTWDGNLNAETTVDLYGETWNGDALNETAVIMLNGASVWNGTMKDGGTLDLSISTWNDSKVGNTSIKTLNGGMMRGLRGIINKASGDLTIENYTGNAVIGYTHENDDPSKISGPNVKIEKAESGSSIALRTDSSGIDLEDKNEVQSVFDALAKKLTYTAYTTGEKNLDGFVEIAEGLTAGSRAYSISKLTFDQNTGAASASTNFGKAFNSPITGDLAKDTAYKDIASADGNTTTYKFTSDTYINNTINIEGATADPTNMKYGITVNPDEGKTLVMDLQGHDLTVENNIGQGQMAQSTTSIIYALNDKSNIYIKNPGKIDLSTFTAGYYAGAVDAGNRYAKSDSVSLVEIDNQSDWDHAVKIRGVMGMGGVSAGSIFNVNWTGIKVFNHGHVDIKGYVDMYAYGAWNLSALGEDGWINIGGGKLTSENYTSVDAYGAGQIWLNTVDRSGGATMVADTNDLIVEGNMKGSGQWVGAGSGGFINAAFTNSDSYFAGIADAAGGEINIALQNGATWTNRDGGFSYGSGISTNSSAKSDVNYFYGGKDEASRGIIHQMQDGDMTIKNYSGNTMIYFDRDEEKEGKVKGGDVIIENAAKDSVITMRTDSSGIDVNNTDSVNAILNEVAGKLFYNGYTEGERNLSGYAEIAEGLTSSTVAKKADIIFDDNSGAGRVTKEPLGQTTVQFTNSITGVPADDLEYKKAGVIQDGKYVFSETTGIKVGSDSAKAGSSGSLRAAIAVYTGYKYGVDPSDYEHINATVDAEKGLKITNDSDQSYAAGIYSGNGTQFTVNGDVDIDFNYAVQEGSYGSNVGFYGIKQECQNNGSYKGGQAITTINGDLTINIDRQNDLSANYYQASPRYESVAGIVNNEADGSIVNVNGMVDMNIAGSGVIVDSWYDSNNEVNIKGGRIVINNDGNLALGNNHALTAYSGTINMGMAMDAVETQAEGEAALQPGSSLVEIEGNVFTLKNNNPSDAVGYGYNAFDGTINLALATENSYWKGVADNAGADKLGTFNLYLQNGAAWFHEEQGTTYDQSASYTEALKGVFDGVSHVSNFYGGADDSKAGVIFQNSDYGIEIDNYSGNTYVVYGHNSADPAQIIGGDLTIKSAAEDSVITVTTDRNGIDVDNIEQVADVFGSLAEKLIYEGAIVGEGEEAKAENNLEGKLTISEGLTGASLSYKVGNIVFDETTGKGSMDEIFGVQDGNSDPNQPTDPSIEVGKYETLIMSGAKSAMASAALMWRNGLGDLDKRLGDLRLGSEDNGVWVNVYGGNSKYDGQNTEYSTSYKSYQLGYDFDLGSGWKAGAAVSYTDGDADYILGGEGELKNTSVSLYGTWLGTKGHYADIVVKGGQVENDFSVYNEMGHKVEGDYKTKGYSVSAEYGRTLETGNGWYVEPQAQLTWGKLKSKAYSAASDVKDGAGNYRNMDISQDGFDSLIGRLGVKVGRGTSDANMYFKASLAHEFKGDFTSSFVAEEAKRTGIDLGGTWAILTLGGSKKVSENSYLYGSIEKSIGGDAVNDWRADLGMRWTF